MKTYMSGKPKRKWFMLAIAGAMLIVAVPTWSVSLIEEAKLFAADGEAGDEFGYSVALSGDMAVITANADDSDANGVDVGSAYVFTRTGTAWSQKTKLTAADGKAGDQFGGKVAISGDTAVVGARLVDDEVKGIDSGSVYIFTGLLDAGDEGV